MKQDEDDDKPILADLPKEEPARASGPSWRDSPEPSPLPMHRQGNFDRRLLRRLPRRDGAAIELVISRGPFSELLEIVKVRPDGSTAITFSLHHDELPAMQEAFRVFDDAWRERDVSRPKANTAYRPKHDEVVPLGRGVPRGAAQPPKTPKK